MPGHGEPPDPKRPSPVGAPRPFASGVGSAQPWEPKPGVPYSDQELEREAEKHFLANRRRERIAALRRYLLVLLLTFIGSAIGSMMTLVTLSYY